MVQDGASLIDGNERIVARRAIRHVLPFVVKRCILTTAFNTLPGNPVDCRSGPVLRL
jgi:hypothetical protein